MNAPSLTDAVRSELLAHPDVTEAPHRFGGVVFHLGGRELGHLHGETVADLPFPAHIRAELVASGRLAPHEVSDSDWVSRRITGPHDVAQVVELFRISLEHAIEAGPLPVEEPAEEPAQPAGRGARWREALGLPSRSVLRRRARQ